MPKETYYITTAIAYPNAKPHIGYAYELIMADFLARWNSLLGKDVFFLTGTDEHGQKIENTAKKEGKTPKQFVDEYVTYFQELCKNLNIANNNFIRTTEKRHTKTCQEIFKKVQDKGLIYKGTYEGLYCTGCEAFYTEKDLKEGKCPNHLKVPELLKEESYFFKMSVFQEQLIKHIENHPNFIFPESRRKEILNRLQEPLKDLSVSRTSFKWGIPVLGDTKHVIYVWFDALLNYISGIGYPGKKFQKYWPANCHVVGKDIAWFHTVIWQTMLMAADIELSKTVYSHGFLTVDGQKMSKTLGNVIDPIEICDKYNADSIRYVLLRDVVPGEDGDFSEKNLVNRNNADLADALGNLLQRTSTLIHKNFNGSIPVCGKLISKEKELESAIPEIAELNNLVEQYQWNKLIELVWQYIHQCNKYVNDTQPWTLEGERLATVLYTLIEHLRIISILVWPIIPESAEKLAEKLGQPLGKLKDAKFKKSTRGIVAAPEPLFKKFEYAEEEKSLLNIKAGKIISAQKHPEADKLYILLVDIETEKRTIVSGLRDYCTEQDLLDKTILLLVNLTPAKIRGIESQGMVLTYEHGSVIKPVEINAKPGEQITIGELKPQTKNILFSEFEKLKLQVQNNNLICDGKILQINGKPIHTDMPNGTNIR